MMGKRTLLVIAALVLMAGAVFAIWVSSPDIPDVAPYQESTDVAVSKVDEAVQKLEQIQQESWRRVREEARIVHVVQGKEVDSLPADAVAAALNRHLSEFRRIPVDTGGIETDTP